LPLADLTLGKPVSRPERSLALDVLRRYDRPGPRYTSYPTAVEFHDQFDETAYRRKLAEAASDADRQLSLYMHLPFCEERCAFCGCMVIITRKREVAARYLEALERELAMLAGALGSRRRLAQWHWGGGTPTYLSPAQLEHLYAATLAHFEVADGAEVAVEIDPRVTTVEHLETLARLGFNRLSMGVQDFTPEVQQAIGRIQSLDETRRLYDHARHLGLTSINVDLIYGLPKQTLATFAETIDAIVAMRPDRLAVYSFAHVPWVRGNQKRIDPATLPPAELKLELFVEARHRLLGAGYRQIGMDHFALPSDELARAAGRGVLHSDIMGYTPRPAWGNGCLV
jgi:oxygen-independent coproporphyrinogen-3 oxidase